MNIVQTSSKLYSSNLLVENKISKTPSFGAIKPDSRYNKFMGPFEDKIAIKLAKVIQKKPVEKLVRKTIKHKSFSDKLFSHLIVAGSLLLSGFYVAKTLTNKKLEEAKRKTLAINQGIVCVVSTVMAYTFDDWAKKKFNEKVIDKFKVANAGNKNLDTYVKGFGIARTTIIIDMVYRFIAPVLVTPIANKIGNKCNEKK